MTTGKKSPAARCNGDQAVENLGRELSASDHAMPHRIALHPTSGNDWWNWCLTVDGKPAIRFRNLKIAARALAYALDDMENGMEIATRDHLYLDIASWALTPGDDPTDEFEVVEGWS